MKHKQVFLDLVRAGLWEKEIQLMPYGDIDFNVVFKLAEEQSVIGLVTAGLEHITDVKLPQQVVYAFIGATLRLEKRNRGMNDFINVMVKEFRDKDIFAVIVKGQGIAQCYEKPLWRAAGDVDFLMDESGFTKAKQINGFLDYSKNKEYDKREHIGVNISSWEVEIHLNQDCGLSNRMDKVIREVQNDIFQNGGVRCWNNNGTDVYLPSVDNDVIIIFTHFLKHFYKEGLGIRQICDWCRLLYTYKDSLNYGLLESRISKMRLMSEWKAFASYAVQYLGMPVEAMPFYEKEKKWERKAEKIQRFVIRVGNMGHNRGSAHNKTFVIRKSLAFSRRISDVINHFSIFPLDSMRFFPNIIFNGLRLAAKGIG